MCKLRVLSTDFALSQTVEIKANKYRVPVVSHERRGEDVMINEKVKVSTCEQTAAYLFTGETRGSARAHAHMCLNCQFRPLSTLAPPTSAVSALRVESLQLFTANVIVLSQSILIN